VWNDTQKIIKEASKVLTGKSKKAKSLALWDGKTAERIIRILAGLLQGLTNALSKSIEG